MRNIYRIFGLGLALLLGRRRCRRLSIPGSASTGFSAASIVLEAHFVQTVETEKGVTGPLAGHLLPAAPRPIPLGLRRRERPAHRRRRQARVAARPRAGAGLPPGPGRTRCAERRRSCWQQMSPWRSISPLPTVANSMARLGWNWCPATRSRSSPRCAWASPATSCRAHRDVGQVRPVHAVVLCRTCKRNPPLDPALFKFEPPPGWDVFQTH